ncbi:MAG: MBL fold metallo-hydrolase [Deltaproteobacteria bacterium]|nr:MBL fold metallo-hydrolase [Deltaproteobacteria bacterium]
MKIHHLNCGTVRPRGAAALIPAFSVLPCHCLLVEAPDCLVLVDAGLGLADMDDPSRLGPMALVLNVDKNPDQTAARQVKRLGFSPSDVRHILCTHLDLDHAGGLADFPHATVHVLKEELEAATHPKLGRERSRYRPCHLAHGPAFAAHGPAAETWFDMECIQPRGLPDGFLLVPLPGHTRGHAAVAVNRGDRWLLHCGDAYNCRAELTPGGKAPVGMRAFQRVAHMDGKRAAARLSRLRAALEKAGGQILPLATHEPVDYETFSGEKIEGKSMR